MSTFSNKNVKILKNEKEEVKKDVHYIGKLDKNKIGEYKDKIITDDVIMTNERIKHTQERHPR